MRRSVRVPAHELGTDPGHELQTVYRKLLAGSEPSPAVVISAMAGTAGIGKFELMAPVVPRQLPLPPGAFTGRVRRAGRARPHRRRRVGVGSRDRRHGGRRQDRAGGSRRTPPGRPLSRRASWDAGPGRWPSTGLCPLEPLTVLGRFLRAFGTEPGAVPTTVEEASAAFRSLVADRRLLVVLDNGADAGQIRPLLPGGSGCRVLVTSRWPLPSVDGAHHLHLGTLAAGEAIELLARVAGRDRLALEPEAAAEVAAWCGWLPLALRIAGARLAMRPGWPVAALAERLAQARRRLDELELGEAGVRASFASSFEHLDSSADRVDRAAAQAFGLLGLLDGPQVGVPVAARLLGEPDDAAERVLERLVDAQILETPSPGRYRMHDLLRRQRTAIWPAGGIPRRSGPRR